MATAVDALNRDTMPSHEGDMTIEGHGFEPIPETARYGSLWRVFTVWFTPNLVPAAFAIGTLAAADFLQVGFVTGLAAILVGNVVGSLLVALLGQMGPATGMAQMPLARLAYGKSIILPGLLNWLSCIGWDGINNVFGAVALTVIVPAIPFWAALLIIVVFQGFLGVIGYEAIHTFEKYMAIVLAILFAVVTVAILPKSSTGIARTDGFSGLDQLGAFILFSSITASFVLAWALYASDYSRYLPADSSRSGIFWRTLLALTISAGWIELLGLLVADQATSGPVDVINTLLGGGLVSTVAMIAIVLGTVAVNALNDYTGSLSLQAAGVRVRRIYSAITVAALGFLFTLYLNSGDFSTKFENYLLFISYWIAPWAAVVLADWWLRGRRADVSRLTNFGALPSGIPGLAALIIGFVASLPFQTSAFGADMASSTGLPINSIAANQLHYADFAYLVGFAIAFLVFWVVGRGSSRTA
ncbi:MAG TPA: cytosine permease [Candidatus Limnocylindrales bacterium]|nr:cytosine permease [Candidatus Limnocylindrales bacterium]